jgi:hypothetical protein
MSRTREEDEVPPKLNEEGNPVNIEEDSKSGTSNTPTLEDLIKSLRSSRPRTISLGQKKKTKVYSSSREDSNFELEVSKKGRKGRKHNNHSYKSMSFNYNTMPSSTAYTSIPIGRVPCFKL